MNNQRRNFRLTCALLAAVLAVGVAGCAQPAEDKQPQGKTQQLWIADNFVDPQEGYPMENPSAIELSATAALQKNSLLNGQTQKQQQSQEMKAVWLSYLDLKPMLLDKNDKSVGKAQFTQNIQKAFDNIQQLGLNTVIAQVRPFSDALYESELFPWSYLATGEEGADPGFDPLAIMVEQAHQRGLQLHAWVNPYRVRTSATNKQLSSKNPAVKLLKSGDAIRYNGAVTYDPASKKAQQLIVDGVREIVEKYDVDGIHFDDYFYPATEESIDAAQFAASGAADLAAWRRQNVTALVKKVRDTVKTADPTLRFGISPQGNPDNDLNSQYSDVTAWLAAGGEEQVVDYLCPQIYWGYGYTLQSGSTRFAFENIVPAWLAYPRAEGVALYFGLGAYRVGTGDGGANPDSVSGWSTGDVLARQVQDLRSQNAGGWALYRYGSLFGAGAPEQAAAECAALRAVTGKET